MIYVVRQRYKEHVRPADYPKINQVINEGVIPSMEKIQGVRSVRAFNSLAGEVILLVEIDELAAIDRALADDEYGLIAAKMFDYMVRVGGEIWYDRDAWEGCYGRYS